MSTSLNNAQKRYLRGLAHDLKPIILVGAKGPTDALLAELDLALERHELLKVKFSAQDREVRDAWMEELVEKSSSGFDLPRSSLRDATFCSSTLTTLTS